MPTNDSFWNLIVGPYKSMKKSYQSTPIFILVLSILSIILSANQASATKLRVVAYNVACGQWATPERIAQELKVLKPDIVLLSEVPKANRGKKSEGLVTASGR